MTTRSVVTFECSGNRVAIQLETSSTYEKLRMAVKTFDGEVTIFLDSTEISTLIDLLKSARGNLKVDTDF